LSGISDSDGTIAVNGSNRSLQIGSVNKGFLLEIQEMLQTLGVTSKVTMMREEGCHYLPANDGTGGCKLFKTKINYRLLVGSCGLCDLKSLGFTTARLDIDQVDPQRNSEQYEEDRKAYCHHNIPKPTDIMTCIIAVINLYILLKQFFHS